MGSSPTQLALKWFQLVILEWEWPEGVMHSTLYLKCSPWASLISLLVAGALWSAFWRSSSHTCIPAVPIHLLLPTLSVVMSGWRSDVKGSERRGGSILPYCLLRRRGLDRSGDASESLYLCNIFAVWSLISQLCSFFKADGFSLFFFLICFHPLCSELSVPISLFCNPLPSFSLSQGSSLSSKSEKEPRFMLEEIKVNDHWLIFIFCGCGWRSNQCRWPCQLGVFLCHQENKESAGIELPQLFQN